jgi:hypothetical protein
MVKNAQTGKRAASAAARTLSGTGTKKDARIAAASALAQRPERKDTKKGKK